MSPLFSHFSTFPPISGHFSFSLYFFKFSSDFLKFTFFTYFMLIHSFILETYIAPLQETRPTTQRCSQPSHGQKRTSERCKIWKGGPSARNADQSGDHSMLMDPQPKRPFAA